MSRLDSFIRRLRAQKILIEHAVRLIGDVPGPVLELGLGMGRTCDHLRALMPEREIFAFDLFIVAPPDLVPDARHMIVGEIAETLAFCGPRVGAPAALLHNDIGSGDEIHNAATRAWLSPLVPPRMAPGGVVVTSFTLSLPGYEKLPLPDGVQPDRYHLYRAPAARS
jgi:hypothetical protein